MRSLLFAIFAIFCGYLPAQSVNVGQWRLSKRNANGTYTDYGFTAENGKAIGFNAGSPAMLTTGGDLTIGTTAITGATNGRALYNNSGVLGELDLAALYAPLASPTFTGNVTIPSGASIAGYLTTATAASTYAPIASPTFTGTITTGSGGIINPNPILTTRSIQMVNGVLGWNNVNGSGFSVSFSPSTPTADRIVQFDPNGAIVGTNDTGSVTSTMILNGTIVAADIADSTITGAKLATSYLPLAGGTATGLIQFSGTGHAGLRLNNLTTTQRDALTPSAGMAIWNTTTSRLNIHNGTSWSAGMVRLDGDTMTGNLTVPIVYPNQTATRPQFALSTATTTGIGIASDRVEAWIGGSVVANFVAGEWQPGSANINWGSNTRLYGNSDGTGRLVQRNGTSAQTFSIANTYTSFTNKEEFEIGWVSNSNICRLKPIKGSGGGSSRNAEYWTTETGVNWGSGSGSPEGVRTAPVGSLYTRTDGGASTTLYVKESGTGNTGWVAK